MYIPGLILGFVSLFNRAAHATYTLQTTYDASNFFTLFDFFTEQDPTKGFVEYVDASTADMDGLAGYQNGAIYMGVDTNTINPANGRKSVRVTSQQSFTHGLFIADIVHMPGSICGVWPSMWFFGPDWPTSGEIDVLEGINTRTQNAITLHTRPGCYITNEGTVQSTTLAKSNCNAGCGQITSDIWNYGTGFNANGGGVYATQWTSDHISVWFFPRNQIPYDITNGCPDPYTWGLASARFNGGSGCDIDTHFKDNNLVFDTTFCGEWAGDPEIWMNTIACSALAPSCNDYVAANPAAFTEAYWLINSVKVYQ
ncbi:concanavalin A-like lectin/glucanase domain-containing protein [Ilyonectria destructans]|nr:concanavalin A-like lectin/glucanase domain-containing protein [Ilyonectria destructans]